MAQIRVTDHLLRMLKGVKKKSAKRTGRFYTFEELIEKALENFDVNQLDDPCEDCDDAPYCEGCEYE